MIKDVVVKNLESVIAKLGVKNIDIDLERPVNPQFGDYSSSIALKLTKQLKKNPLEIAQNIIDQLPHLSAVAKTEVIKPGFINFWLDNEYLLQEAKKMYAGNIEYLPFHLGKTKKIMIEYAHPNTHKLFHIGHLRNIATGESIVRILETAGNQIIRSNYQGDVGLHIAKCLYKIKNEKLKIKSLKTIQEKIRFLGQAYSEGQKAYETDEKAKEEIHQINKMIYDQDKKILELWQETRQWSLDYFDTIYKRVYSQFDRLYFESEETKRGVELTEKALKDGILEKSEGAIVFKGKQYGLDTRVFINSLGFPTYEGKELALSEKEFSEFGEIDKCIHLTTPEQASFFKVTFKVEELIDPKKFKNKQYHLTYEWVKLKEGKMSSREGNVIEGEWLIDETKNKILGLFKCDDAVAETLAVAAIKYSFLKNGVGNTIAFDIKESVSLEGNSGPYLLYTYVRTQSVLKKSDPSKNVVLKNIGKEEEQLLRLFYQFPETVRKAAENYAPNYIATYLFELAQQFNLFYQKCPILKADTSVRNLRLLLTKTTGILLKNGLYLLGIKTVERM